MYLRFNGDDKSDINVHRGKLRRVTAFTCLRSTVVNHREGLNVEITADTP